MTNPDTDDDTESGGLLDLFAQFSLSLDGLQTELTRMNDYNDARDVAARRNLPRQLPLMFESVSAAAADVLDFGGPQAGRKWEARMLGVFSVTSAGVFVPMATTVSTWYVGQKAGALAPGVFNPLQLRWQRPSVPFFDDFTADQIQVLPRENLLLGLTGIPAAPTQIYGLAIINDMPLYVGRVVSGS